MENFKLLLVFIVGMQFTFSIAQPNRLDSSFSGDGIAMTILAKKSLINDIALQSDGKIVAVGKTDNGEYNKIAIARYNSDGSLDSSFGNEGIVITSIGKKADMAKSVAIQADGKIVVAGYTFNGKDDDFAVLRYNKDGTLDKNFGKGGIVTTAIGFIIDLNDRANSVLLQPDGKIVVGGTASGYFCLIRYNRDGSQDESFNYDGIVSIPAGNLDNDGKDIAIQEDGKILILGSALIEFDWDFCVLRFDRNGLLDSSFGNKGIAVIELEDLSSYVNEYPTCMAIQSNGKIILAGRKGADFFVMRLNQYGKLDLTFGSNGLINDFYGDARSIAVQPDDKIIVAGSSYDDNFRTMAFSWIRYKKDGIPDCSKISKIGPKWDDGNSILIQPDGKILMAGHSDLNFALARYMGDPLESKIDEYHPEVYLILFPNPVKNKFTLDYTLEDDDFVTIELWDMLGRKVNTYLNKEKQLSGNNYYSLFLPEDLINGNYIVNFSSQNFQKRIKIVKN